MTISEGLNEEIVVPQESKNPSKLVHNLKVRWPPLVSRLNQPRSRLSASPSKDRTEDMPSDSSFQMTIDSMEYQGLDLEEATPQERLRPGDLPLIKQSSWGAISNIRSDSFHDSFDSEVSASARSSYFNMVDSSFTASGDRAIFLSPSTSVIDPAAGASTDLVDSSRSSNKFASQFESSARQDLLIELWRNQEGTFP